MSVNKYIRILSFTLGMIGLKTSPKAENNTHTTMMISKIEQLHDSCISQGRIKHAEVLLTKTYRQSQLSAL